jgi:hypothetical protein
LRTKPGVFQKPFIRGLFRQRGSPGVVFCVFDLERAPDFDAYLLIDKAAGTIFGDADWIKDLPG